MSLEVMSLQRKEFNKSRIMTEPPLKAKEVAQRKNVSPATVTRWMKREIDPLPSKRNSGLVRIEVADLEDWYQRNFL